MRTRRTVAALAAAALVGGLAAATNVQAAEAPVPPAEADPALAGALAAGGDLTVFVTGTDIDIAVDAVDAAGLDLVETWDKVDIAVGHGPVDAVESLLDIEGVLRVEPNADISFDLDTAHQATRAEEARDPASGLTLPGGLPYDGSGITVAVIDSGIDATHPFFQRSDGSNVVVRNMRQACVIAICSSFVEAPDTDTLAYSGHGTHVAGIVAGQEDHALDGRMVRGAAPGADIVGLGVGIGLNLFNVDSALNWVLENHMNPCGDGSCAPIRVVNNSWGSSGDGFDPGDATSVLTSALIDAGVTVVFAAGNDGGDGTSNQVNPEGLNPKPGMIAVANYNDGEAGLRDGELASGSSRGEDGRVETYPDLAAPGSNILSSCRPWMAICYVGLGPDTGMEYFEETGTSMAAPYVAGAIALMLQADPSLTPAEIEDLLEDTAYEFGDPSTYEADTYVDHTGTTRSNGDSLTSFDKGHGLLDVVELLAAVLNRPAPPVASCAPGASSTSFTDPTGDATAYVIETGAAPLNDGALDIVAADITWDDTTDTVTFVVTAADIKDTPPSGALGEYYDLNFSVGGASYYITANWSRVEGEDFRLGRFETTRTTLATGLNGSFDPITDTITVTLPAVIVNGEGATVFEIPDGGTIGGFDFISRRDTFVFVPNADQAVGGCPVTAAR